MTMMNFFKDIKVNVENREKKILKNFGSISHKKAIEKAESEYEKYRIKQDQEYISSMDEMYKRYLEGEKNMFNTRSLI